MQETEVIEHITAWLAQYQQRSGTRGFVVGVSGGIDSAVCSALCARTGLPTLCVEMPIHQGTAQVDRAKEHISFLEQEYPNVERQEVNLSQVFDNMVKTLPEFPNNELPLANTRARLRMCTLYYLAGAKGFLVVGTGNKVEDFGVGFYTKYGDGGVDISPIADLMKSEVYALGKELGVKDAILTAPPTDGLFGDSRTDEDQLGATYDELEWAMEFAGSETNLDERQKQVLDIYRRLNAANQHKMQPIPVCKIPSQLRQ